MRLYLAALYSNGFYPGSKLYDGLDVIEQRARFEIDAILESYHYVGEQKHVDIIRKGGRKIFLDSGAFSALNRNVSIDINAYCQYIQRNQDIIEIASVLDGIGDPQLTYQNQKYMEQQGLKVLPCFHHGEDPQYLDYYLGAYDYITIGGMVRVKTGALIKWLDHIWEHHLIDGAGRPRVKVHGFGITSLTIAMRYPWHSLDSSGWVQKGNFGEILIPELGKSLIISKNSPNVKNLDKHLDTLDPESQKQILNYIRWLGFDPLRLREFYPARWAYNCYAYKRLGELTTKTKDFVFEQPQIGLFA